MHKLIHINSFSIYSRINLRRIVNLPFYKYLAIDTIYVHSGFLFADGLEAIEGFGAAGTQDVVCLGATVVSVVRVVCGGGEIELQGGQEVVEFQLGVVCAGNQEILWVEQETCNTIFVITIIQFINNHQHKSNNLIQSNPIHNLLPHQSSILHLLHIRPIASNPKSTTFSPILRDRHQRYQWIIVELGHLEQIDFILTFADIVCGMPLDCSDKKLGVCGDLAFYAVMFVGFQMNVLGGYQGWLRYQHTPIFLLHFNQLLTTNIIQHLNLIIFLLNLITNLQRHILNFIQHHHNLFQLFHVIVDNYSNLFIYQGSS